MNFLDLWKYCRIKPFDTSTEQGRSSERYRLALLSIATNVLSRASGMVVMLVSVKVTIPYLGAERFGIWMTIASIVGLLSFMDMGVGNALVNRVSDAVAKDNQPKLREVVSGGLAFLFALGVVTSCALYLFFEFFPWSRFLKLGDAGNALESSNALSVLSAFFGVSIFAGGAHRVFAGLQRAYVGHLVSLLFSIVSLSLLVIAAGHQAGIPVLVAVTLGIQTLSGIALWIVLAWRGTFELKGSFKHALTQRQDLLKVGGLFLVLQVGGVIIAGADSLLIMLTHGAAQVAVFSVAQRLFQFVSQPLAVVNAPLWAAYADAHARGDYGFIAKTLKRSLLMTALCSFLGAGAVFMVSDIATQRWTSGTVTLPVGLAFVFFLATMCEAIGNALAMMLNGCGIVREQVVTVAILIVLALGVKLFVLTHWGIAEMLASYVAVYCFVVCSMYGFVFRKKLADSLRTTGPQIL